MRIILIYGGMRIILIWGPDDTLAAGQLVRQLFAGEKKAGARPARKGTRGRRLGEQGTQGVQGNQGQDGARQGAR